MREDAIYELLIYVQNHILSMPKGLIVRFPCLAYFGRNALSFRELDICGCDTLLGV